MASFGFVKMTFTLGGKGFDYHVVWSSKARNFSFAEFGALCQAEYLDNK
jgi:hypothetical protein